MTGPRTARVRARLEDFGRTWPLIRPAESRAEALIVPEGENLDGSYVLRFFTEHVHPDARPDYVRSVDEAPSLTWGDLAATMEAVAPILYRGLSLTALNWLWADWPKRRHVYHAHLIASGGAEPLDLYDVACLMWAELEGIVTSTDMVRGPHSRAMELADTIMRARRSADDKADVDQIKALLTRRMRPTEDHSGE